MTTSTLLQSSLLAVLLSTATAWPKQLNMPIYSDSNTINNNNLQWQSLSNGDQIQMDERLYQDLMSKKKQQLHRNLMVGSTAFESLFVDGAETYYDAYAQAWRLLGMYIDCNALQEDEDHDKGSGCQRFLLWAAYVDLDYTGGGIGEYMYWDRQQERWDSSACKAHGGTRCVPMDCHLPDSTNFALLGYYKEANYEEWMEQLFKHEGVCVWTDEEYEFMQADREAWPQGCTETDEKDEDGNRLYIDAKPIAGGGMTIGLYIDYRCSQDYLGDSTDLEQVLMSYYGEEAEDDYYHNTYQLSEYIDTWNDAFDIYHYCQPCKAYNLEYIPEDQYTQDNRDKYDEDYDDQYNGGAENGDDDNDANQGYFSCNDDANYHNVNQCMKFRTKTKMRTASYSDILLAQQQGTITQAGHGGVVYHARTEMVRGIKSELGFFFGSCVTLGVGMMMLFMALYKSHRQQKRAKASLFSEPLVKNKDGVTV